MIANAIAWENGPVEYVDFDYGEVDRALGVEDEPSSEAILAGLSRILQWINNGANARAKEIRIQAVRYFFEPQKNQVDLAREIGVKKATISQKAVEFRDYFKIQRPAGAATQMRSDEARQKFSEVCKLKHQQRKALSNSNA